jgi:hypothetical protein
MLFQTQSTAAFPRFTWSWLREATWSLRETIEPREHGYESGEQWRAVARFVPVSLARVSLPCSSAR